MRELLRDPRVRRLVVANTLGSIGSGVTIFAVPWLLVGQARGNEIFRWTTMGTTLALFLIMPYVGAWIDRSRRKRILLFGEAFGFAATLGMALVALTSGKVETWQLVASYFCGILYYTLHYPAKFAFIQQLFDRAQYRSLMGLLEIQGQTAMMVAGGLGGMLMGRGVPLSAILLFDAFTYAFSFAVQRGLPDPAAASLPQEGGRLEKRGVWTSVVEAWRWLSSDRRLMVFLSCSYLPFIVVMASNYLFPIYVSQTLGRGAEVYGTGEILFAVGAVAAGLILPRLTVGASAGRIIATAMIIFISGMAALVALPWTGVYLGAAVVLGFGHAGCRVARSALMLHVVPNPVMGRVNVFYNVFDRFMRTALVGSLTIIDYFGARSGFALLLGVSILAWFGALRSRPAAEPRPVH